MPLASGRCGRNRYRFATLDSVPSPIGGGPASPPRPALTSFLQAASIAGCDGRSSGGDSCRCARLGVSRLSFFSFLSLIGLAAAPSDRPSPPARRDRSSPRTTATISASTFASEQNFSLEQCKTACLGDSSCRAFTYNTKAKWCFLKSDYNQLKPFSRRGRRQGRQPQRRARHRRSGRADLLPVLDGRRGAPVPPEPDQRHVAVGEQGLAFLDRRRRAGDADGRSRAAPCRTTPRRS